MSGGKGISPYGIPKDIKLQDFAIMSLLGEANISKIVVGCNDAAHVLGAFHAAIIE